MTTRIVCGLLCFLACAGLLFGQDSAKSEIISKLSNPVKCEYENKSVKDAILDIQQQAGIRNIVFDKEIESKISEGEGEGITLKLHEVTARTALKLILGQKELAATYKDGALMITTREKANKNVYTRVYDIRDLLYQVTNFPGPRVDLLPPDSYKEKYGGLGGGGALGGQTFTLSGGDDRPTADPEFIINVIQTNSKGGVEGWTDNQAIEEKNGMLFVTTTKEKHKEVDRLIALIRQFK